jgi:hypothetical protein
MKSGEKYVESNVCMHGKCVQKCNGRRLAKEDVRI